MLSFLLNPFIFSSSPSRVQEVGSQPSKTSLEYKLEGCFEPDAALSSASGSISQFWGVSSTAFYVVYLIGMMLRWILPPGADCSGIFPNGGEGIVSRGQRLGHWELISFYRDDKILPPPSRLLPC